MRRVYVHGRGSDPAARAAVTDFAEGPAEALAAEYNITPREVAMVKAYLLHLTATYVAPAFAANVLGPPLGPESGGLLAARSVGDWLNGEPARRLLDDFCACPMFNMLLWVIADCWLLILILVSFSFAQCQIHWQTYAHTT